MNVSLSLLVSQYVDLSIQQGRSLDLWESSARVNRLGDQIHAIADELKGRPGDQRRALRNLFFHSNANVRFNAAKSLITIFPVDARETIQLIADSQIFPLAGHAGMYLSLLDGESSDLLRR